MLSAQTMEDRAAASLEHMRGEIEDVDERLVELLAVRLRLARSALSGSAAMRSWRGSEDAGC